MLSNCSSSDSQFSSENETESSLQQQSQSQQPDFDGQFELVNKQQTEQPQPSVHSESQSESQSSENQSADAPPSSNHVVTNDISQDADHSSRPKQFIQDEDLEEGEASDASDDEQQAVDGEGKCSNKRKQPTDEELEDGEVIDDDDSDEDEQDRENGQIVNQKQANNFRIENKDAPYRNNYGRFIPQHNEQDRSNYRRPNQQWETQGERDDQVPSGYVNAWERGVRHAKEMINGDWRPPCEQSSRSMPDDYYSRSQDMYSERFYSREDSNSRHSTERYNDARRRPQDNRRYPPESQSSGLDRYGQPIRCGSSERSYNKSDQWDAEYERRRRLAYESAPWNQDDMNDNFGNEQRDEFGRIRRPPSPPSQHYERSPIRSAPFERASRSPSLSDISNQSPACPSSSRRGRRSYSKYDRECERDRSRSWSSSSDSSSGSSLSSRSSYNSRDRTDYRRSGPSSANSPCRASSDRDVKKVSASNGHLQSHSFKQDDLHENKYKGPTHKKTLNAKNNSSVSTNQKSQSRQPIKIPFMKTQATLRRDDRLLEELSADDSETNDVYERDASSSSKRDRSGDESKMSKDDLLKQLQAVEEAIARKRAKLE